MNLSSGGETRLERTEVRVRKIIGGEGSCQKSLSVFCRQRDQTISLDECVDCTRCERMSIDPKEQNSFLQCYVDTEKEDVRDFGRMIRESWSPSHGLKAEKYEVDLETPISEIMQRNVLCVKPDLSLESLMIILLESGIGGVTVVQEKGHPIGMITKSDLLFQKHEDDMGEEVETARDLKVGNIEMTMGPGFHVENLVTKTVGEVMTPYVYRLPEKASVSRAAALMAYQRIERVPVVSSKGDVVGMVFSMDVLRWLAKKTGFIMPPHDDG